MSNLLERIRARAKSHESPLYDLHPELQYRVPIMRLFADQKGNELPSGQFDENSAFYAHHVWVQKALRVLAENIAPLPLRVVRGEGRDAKPVEGHELAERLELPNPAMDRTHFWREWMVDMMLGGEWGVELIFNGGGDRLLEMWPRQPSQFYIRPGALGRRYREVLEYKIDDGETREPYPLNPDEFIHFKFYNPTNPWRGIAPITAVRMGIRIDQMAEAWSLWFYRNQARPDFAIIAPEGVTRSEKQEIEEELSARHGGANAHKPIVLEQGVTDIKTFSYPPKDLEWLEQRKLSRDEIGGIFGVPDEVMGYGRDTYENFETALEALWAITLVPLIDFRDNALTHFFKARRPLLAGGERIQTDLSDVSQLKEDLSDKIEQWGTLVDRRVPPRTASDFLGLGIPNYPGDDQPVERPLSSRDLALGLSLPAPAAKTQKASPAPEYGSEEHAALLKRIDARLETPRQGMQRKLKRYFQGQQTRIGQALRDAGQRTFGRGLHKGEDDIPSPESLFDMDAEVQRFMDEFLKLIEDAFALAGAAELAELGVEAEFALDDPFVQSQVRHILETVARRTNETTWLDLIELFEEAERAGEGIPAIQERLAAYFGDRKSDWQTERIARTTMTGASNASAVEAWGQSGVVKTKTWVSALLPNRTRDAHAAAHGQTVPLRGLFEVGGEHMAFPGDPNASPGNIINCLCVHVAGVEG